MIARKLLSLIFIVWLPAFSVAQTSFKGNLHLSGNITANLVSGSFFAALPLNWVNSGLTSGTGFCPTSGFDATKTMKAAGGDYTPTFAQLRQAKLDQIAANQQWLLVIDAGTNLHGSSFNADNALVTMPANTGGVTKCLVVRSSTHNTDGVQVCAHGLVGYNASLNPGCTNDIAKMWTITVDSTPTSGFTGLYFAAGDNYTVIEDVEITIAKGAFQGANGVKVVQLSVMDCNFCGIAYSYIHGYDPGDSGQPAGACNNSINSWQMTGTVNTVNADATHGTVTWVNGKRFGMSFSDGTHSAGFPQATITINGSPFTISNHDPTNTASNGSGGLIGDTVLTVNGQPGTQSGVAYTLTNPMTKYANGCGDDARGIQVNGSNYFLEYNYAEKIHWTNNESHIIAAGRGTGPGKIAHNNLIGGSVAVFAGGFPVDLQGGPANDIEFRGNFLGVDLGWRFLSASANKSPHPPFGCGPLDTVNNPPNGTLGNRQNCPFNWGLKNRTELKLGARVLRDGNIYDGSWADGQSGYGLLQNVRACSGGQDCGIFDPVTGVPATYLHDVRDSNCWVRNVPQIYQMSSRSLSSGNGGGVSQPIENVDYINCLYSNVGDDNQFGSPGNDIFQWGGGGANTFLCNMSGDGVTVHASCAPISIANYAVGQAGVLDSSFDVSSVIRAGTTVTMKFNANRQDPVNGGTVTVGNVAGWNGTFTISDILNSGVNTRCTTDLNGNPVAAAIAVGPQPCVRNDGTFADTITYTDGQGAPGTLCSNLTTCNATNIQVQIPTHAFQIADISAGDNVYAHNCTNAAYNAGATSAVLAVAPTLATGLDIYYPSTGTGAATCQIENNSGYPKNASWQNNTVLALGIMSISSSALSKQSFNNLFAHNVFAMPTGNAAVLTCTPVGGQGTAVYACWDANTFQFFDNVMQGRTSSQWSVVPSSAAPNAFPTTVECSGSTATSACLGYSAYMSGNTFPSTSCTYDGSDPTNCPMMASPWSANFDLSKIGYVPSSSYATEGVNITNLTSAFTATQYTCPAGANCGTGPKPD